MKKMLWGGRFNKAPSSAIVDFNSAENIRLDVALIPFDIIGSLAHIQMLRKQKILTKAEYESLKKALKAVFAQWDERRFVLKKELEDVHMNIESAVSAITPAGKKMHTARSRNDQVLLDMRLYMRDGVLEAISALEGLRHTFAALSEKDGPMVAYTHTRVAQPITVSFWCEGWAQSFGRDMERLIEAYRRINQNPLGACAISGTSWNIDREETARLLGFGSVQKNEFDTINSRGECEAELLSILSIVMCKLSRLSEELIWLSEKGLISIAEEHTTGSSIMPNKKNPDVLEIIRGRTGRLYGNLNHCLVSLKGLMPGYNSDMQETKYAVMSGLETARASISAMAVVVEWLGFDKNRIEAELDQGFAQATEIADYLAMHGMPFREAHERTGGLVRHCEKIGKTISMLDSNEAGKLLGTEISEKDWVVLKGFERERLKRKIRLEEPGSARGEGKKIEGTFKDWILLKGFDKKELEWKLRLEPSGFVREERLRIECSLRKLF